MEQVNNGQLTPQPSHYYQAPSAPPPHLFEGPEKSSSKKSCQHTLSVLLSVALVTIGILGLTEVLPISIGGSLAFLMAGGFVYIIGMIQSMENRLLEKTTTFY